MPGPPPGDAGISARMTSKSWIFIYYKRFCLGDQHRRQGPFCTFIHFFRAKPHMVPGGTVRRPAQRGEQALTYADAAAYDYKKSILGGQARAAGDKGRVPPGPEDRRGEH